MINVIYEEYMQIRREQANWFRRFVRRFEPTITTEIRELQWHMEWGTPRSQCRNPDDLSHKVKNMVLERLNGS